MIGIKIRGKWLDLFPDQTLTFDLNNPAYLGDDVDVIQGAFSFPSEIPLTATNRQTLKNPQRLDNAAVFISEETAEVWAEGTMLFPALATIREASNGSAKMTLLVGWISKLKDTKLNKLAFPATYALGSTSAASRALALTIANNPLDYDFNFFPIFNPDFKPDAGPTSIAPDRFQNHFASGAFTEDVNRAVTPFLRLEPILAKIFEGVGCTLKNEFQITPELQLLMIYSQFNISDWATGAWPTEFTTANHLPDVTAGEYLKNIARLFNLGVFVNYFDKTATLKPVNALLQQPPKHDWTRAALVDYTVSNPSNYPTRLKYPDIAPEIYLKSVFEHKADQRETEDVNDLTLSDPSGDYIERTTGLLYKVDTTGVSVVLTLKGKVMPEVLGSSDMVFESPISTTWMFGSDAVEYLGHPPTEELSPDRDSQTRTAGTYDDVTNACPKKLLFYRGMVPHHLSGGYAFPMGDSGYAKFNKDTVNVLGTTPAQYSLMWNGERGIDNRFWLDWRNMLKARKEITRNFALSIRQLRAFSFEDKVRVGNQHYFVKKLHVTLSRRGLEITEAELVSII